MMAKKKAAGGVNKAAAIRDYLKANPNARGVDVVEALAKQGIKVAAAQVSNVKVAAKKGGKKSGKKMGRPRTNGISTHGIVATLQLAKSLIAAAGSAEDAKVIIDALS